MDDGKPVSASSRTLRPGSTDKVNDIRLSRPQDGELELVFPQDNPSNAIPVIDGPPNSNVDVAPENTNFGSQLHMPESVIKLQERFKASSMAIANASKDKNSSHSVKIEHGGHFPSFHFHSPRQRSPSTHTPTPLSRSSSFMSPISNDAHEEGVKIHSVHNIENAMHATSGAVVGTSASAIKRGRGRPKGSKNKRSVASPAEDQWRMPRKRSRVRPQKMPVGAGAKAGGKNPRGRNGKKKRGRPPKKDPAL